jgi:hypothetical protein
VADISLGSGPVSIRRFNQQRRVFVGADLAPNFQEGPIKEAIDAAACDELLLELRDAGLIELYSVDGKPCLQMCKWDNNPRAKESKYPAPDDGRAHLRASACKPRTHLPVTGTETGTENRKPEPLDAPRAEAHDAGPSVISIPLVGGGSHGVTAERIAYFAEHYPAVDIMAELRTMAVWCDANPTRRKTPRGIAAFVANWLSKAQDRGGSSPIPAASGAPIPAVAKGAAIEAHNAEVARRYLENNPQPMQQEIDA